MAHEKNHDYHILQPSIWPLLGGVAAFVNGQSATMLMALCAPLMGIGLAAEGAGLWMHARDMDRAQSEIAYWVVPAFWNTGLASEAVRALVGANPRGDQTMFASVFQDNPASARVLTNAGFEYLGDAEAFSVARGSVVPTWTYLKRLT